MSFDPCGRRSKVKSYQDLWAHAHIHTDWELPWFHFICKTRETKYLNEFFFLYIGEGEREVCWEERKEGGREKKKEERKNIGRKNGRKEWRIEKMKEQSEKQGRSEAELFLHTCLEKYTWVCLMCRHNLKWPSTNALVHKTRKIHHFKCLKKFVMICLVSVEHLSAVSFRMVNNWSIFYRHL